MVINLKKFLLSEDPIMNIHQILNVSDKDLLEDCKLNKEIILDGKFFKVDDSLLLNADLTYSYSETCARCLEEFENKIVTKFNAVIVNELDDEAESLEILIDDGCIDLEESVKQIVYLSMPMKALCKEDCKGICPICGINLNTGKCECNDCVIDPRLEKLKTLLRD